MIQAKSMIDNKIEALEQQLLEVKGRETEKYARIVGYYRAVKNWNKGKKEEFKFRVNFSETTFHEGINGKVEKLKTTPVEIIQSAKKENIASYLFFYRTSCPNCPPVKRIISTLEINGESINADESKGFTKAAQYEVFAAPTVIFLDINGKEVLRTSKASEIQQLLDDKKII
ncbi:MAG: thiol reductase thioredoxin [Spirochaetales bacterium]|nr:thiol reductase thioredoxin [Spirochaetales bacterium]